MKPYLTALVIDDSAYNRRTLSRLLEETGFVQVVATASDGEEGLRRALALGPDLVTVDLEMPRMDGFTFLRILMARRPTPVIVISGQADDQNVFRALDFGAVDFLPKPTRYISDRLLDIKDELAAKVGAVREMQIENLGKRVAAVGDARGSSGGGNLRGTAAVSDAVRPIEGENLREAPEVGLAPPGKAVLEVVVMGASTGGPTAIQAILSALGDRFPLPIVIAQHMPPAFTRAFAERLDRLSPLEVREARDGDMLASGQALIAPGGCNTVVARVGQALGVRTETRTATQSYIPSVDMLFESAAEAAGRATLGVLLTGMGSDGRRGMVRIKAAGGQTIAESEETAIIFGMPREAIAAGAVDLVAPLPGIAAEIVRRAWVEIA